MAVNLRSHLLSCNRMQAMRHLLRVRRQAMRRLPRVKRQVMRHRPRVRPEMRQLLKERLAMRHQPKVRRLVMRQQPKVRRQVMRHLLKMVKLPKEQKVMKKPVRMKLQLILEMPLVRKEPARRELVRKELVRREPVRKELKKCQKRRLKRRQRRHQCQSNSSNRTPNCQTSPSKNLSGNSLTSLQLVRRRTAFSSKI